MVRADGGAGTAYSGGGGGRTALHYNPAAQASMPTPALRFTVNPGRGFRPLTEASTQYLSDRTAYVHREHEADWGSLYFSDASGVVQLAETIGNVSGYLTFGNAVTNLSLGSLTLDNAWFGFDGGGIIDLSGNLVIGGGMTVTGANANVMLRGVDAAVTGKVHIVDGGWLSAMGNTIDGSIGDAAMRLDVEGDILIATNGSLFVYADADQGGSPRFRCRDLVVHAGGAFRADERGYAANLGPGKGALGGAPDGSPTGAGGAGHGGPGGKSANNIAGGIAYGSALLPDAPGSGGGYCSNAGRGGSGGGLIRIRVERTAIINGAINAGGADGGNDDLTRAPGGGSGGGIQLVASGAVRGGPSGLLTAAGGSSGDPTHVAGGGGGGGRIAVWQFVPDAFYDQILSGDFSLAISNSVPVQFAGSWSVDGGQGFVDGGDGTVVFYRAPPAGTLFLIR